MSWAAHIEAARGRSRPCPCRRCEPARRERSCRCRSRRSGCGFWSSVGAGPAYNMPGRCGSGRFGCRGAGACVCERSSERHEGLRTRFAEADGKPVQVIEPAARFGLAGRICRGWRTAERGGGAGLMRAGCGGRLIWNGGRCFGLACCGCRRRSIAAWAMHHIVSDGWSMGVLIREIGVLYGLSRRVSRHRCRSWPCSMRTMRCGSATGCGAKCWRSRLRTGRRAWRGAGGARAADRPGAAGGAEL